jgi:phosphoribosylformylglycinamidine synthase subunit PurQ / glutaminase
MKSSVIVFPASNCDRDVATALTQVTGKRPAMVWHGGAEVPAGTDLIVLPGGFSYGDYLRAGAMAAHSPIMRDVIEKAKAGTPVLGICNGFQILCEAGLLPGALIKNASLSFVCRSVKLKVEHTNTMFTRAYAPGQEASIPVAHGMGNYVADENTLNALEGDGRVAFRYTPGANPNGAARDIAGIFNEKRTILGMMPHPERACDMALGSEDGKGVFQSLLGALS